MTISQTSYFRTPPLILPKKQVLIFNGITYSIDICDIAFSRLTENLYNFSFPKDGNLVPSFPAIFSDVWAIINHATIFCNIVTRLFEISKNDTIFEMLRGIEFLRHSQQHIDERIEEVLLEKDLPIYGSISWYAQMEPDSIDGKIITIISGTFTNKESIIPLVVKPVGKTNYMRINDIEFSLTIKINKKFEVKTISINALMADLSLIINHFEKQLGDQLKYYEPIERHKNDLTFTLTTRRL